MRVISALFSQFTKTSHLFNLILQNRFWVPGRRILLTRLGRNLPKRWYPNPEEMGSLILGKNGFHRFWFEEAP